MDALMHTAILGGTFALAFIGRRVEQELQLRKADNSALDAGVGSKRATTEVFLCAAYFMVTLLLSIHALYGNATYYIPLWLMIIDAVVLVSAPYKRLLDMDPVHLYTGTLAHSFANSQDPGDSVPAHCLSSTRRHSRYVSWFSGVQRRLCPLRTAWVCTAVLHGWVVLRLYSALPDEDRDNVQALLLRHWQSSPWVTCAFLLRLSLALLSCISVCAWRAEDYSGRASARQERWLWPVDQSGEHPIQRPPPRLLSLKEPRSSYPAPLPPPTRKPMRVAILTVGTRGDVQPFLALAVHMREAGHHPVIVTTSDFASFVSSYGIEWCDCGVPRVKQPSDWIRVTSVAQMIAATAADLTGDYPAVASAFAAACVGPQRADVIIGTAMTLTFALNIGQATGIPVWFAKLAPDMPTAGFVLPGQLPSAVGWWNLARGYLYWLRVALAVNGTGINACEEHFRAELGIVPSTIPVGERVEALQYTPTLLGYSRVLMPKPTDLPPWYFQCGFWQFLGSVANAPDMAATSPSQEGQSPSSPSPARTPQAGIPRSGGTPEPVVTPVGVTPVVVRGSTTPGLPPPSSRVDPAMQLFVEEGDSAPASVMSNGRVNLAKLAAWEAARGLPAGKTDTVVVTFGSMVHPARLGLMTDVLRVLLQPHLGLKVVILTGWAGKADDAPTHPRLFYAKEAPHDWLFRQAKFVVHHGGAGTTACALACGAASLVIPVLRWADQMLWGWLVERLNVGVLVRERNPSMETISEAVNKLLDGTKKTAPFWSSVACDAANRYGAVVRAEPASDTALALLESCLCSMVLPPAAADAIHPSRSTAPHPVTLTPEQRMCVRCCVPCNRLRAELGLLVGQGVRLQRFTTSSFSRDGVLPVPTPSPVSSPADSGPEVAGRLRFVEGSPLSSPQDERGGGLQVSEHDVPSRRRTGSRPAQAKVQLEEEEDGYRLAQSTMRVAGAGRTPKRLGPRAAAALQVDTREAQAEQDIRRPSYLTSNAGSTPGGPARRSSRTRS